MIRHFEPYVFVARSGHASAAASQTVGLRLTSAIRNAAIRISQPRRAPAWPSSSPPQSASYWWHD
eukprot:15104421-Alexandrium_andersonii.AAC.1